MPWILTASGGPVSIGSTVIEFSRKVNVSVPSVTLHKFPPGTVGGTNIKGVAIVTGEPAGMIVKLPPLLVVTPGLTKAICDPRLNKVTSTLDEF